MRFAAVADVILTVVHDELELCIILHVSQSVSCESASLLAGWLCVSSFICFSSVGRRSVGLHLHYSL